MLDYAAIASKTATLISDNGRNVTIRKKVKGTPLDADKPWRGDTGSVTDETIPAVISPFSAEEVNGTTIQKGDKRAFVAANAVSAGQRPLIRNFDELIDGTETWRIANIEIIEPGSTPVLFIFHVSKLGS